MRLRTRLHLLALATALTALALVATVLWGASVAGRVLATGQRAGRQAEALRTIGLAMPALLLEAGGAAGRVAQARLALDGAGPLFGPGDGAEELQELRRLVEVAARARPEPRAGAVPGAVDLERDLLDPMTRLAAHGARRDAEASRLGAEAITTTTAIAVALAALALATGLAGALSVASRLRRGLGALEAGARRMGAGDLATPIALSGEDELAWLGSAFDSMAVQLGVLMVPREQAEALVRQRTAELEQAGQDLADRVAQLETAHIQLDASDRLVAADRLARGLTHELNNPLAILLADVEFAGEELEAQAASGGGDTEEVRTALGEARQAGRRIALIVRELMSFSRERAAGDRGVVDLVESLDQAQRLAGPEIRRHATFVTDLPPGPVLVQGTQARLGQVFLELLLGAASAIAGGAGGGLVSLTLRTAPGGAQVEVRDDGQPIPEELRAHLFDPFFMPTAGFTAGGSGLRGAGLGLASCFGIVQAAGGRLEVDSAAGSGTVFRVWLPAATSVSRVALRAPAGRAEGRRRRLLVVDADPFECASAYRTLSKGFDVAPHASVSSALAVLRAGDRFDLILCDPGSGRYLAGALAADGSGQVDAVVLVEDDPQRPEAASAPSGLPRLDRPLSVEAVLALLRRREAPAATT